MEFRGFECDPTASFARFGLSFAEALAVGEFDEASAMLSPPLRSQLAPTALGDRYRSMIEDGSGPALHLEIITTMTEWPAKHPGDVGWVYVAITGERFSEPVTCIVASNAETFAIRDIEWGRP